MKGMGLPDLYIDISVLDKNKDIVDKYSEVGHSWTRNAWNHFNGAMAGFGGQDHTTVQGESYLNCRRYGLNNIDSATNSAAGVAASVSANWWNNITTDTTYGIVVGTSDTPFVSEDYYLYNPIESGNSVGQLAYNTQSSTPTVAYNNVDKTWKNTVTRVFNNNSGSSIIIKEIGLVCKTSGYSSNIYTYLFARDVLSSPVSVPNGGQVTVIYTITSKPFTVCESTAFPIIAAGTAGSGGYLLGNYNSWDHPNNAYLLIVSPITGGQSSALQWKTTATNPPTDVIQNYGYVTTQGLISLGSDSPLGQFCSTANAANLGGYNDWYIPSSLEMSSLLYPNNLSLPESERIPTDTTRLWTSYRNTSTNASYMICSTGVIGNISKTTSYATRLVRRIHSSQWTPA